MITGCTSKNSSDDFAGLPINSSISAIKGQGFSCKIQGDKNRCVRFDNNPTIFNESIKEIYVVFDKKETISYISVTLAKEPNGLEDFLDLTNRLSATYEKRKSKNESNVGPIYMGNWNRSDNSVVRLTITNTIPGFMRGSIDIGLIPSSKVTGDI